VLPWSGPLFLLAILALGAMPPFGIFRSEFEIVEGGFASASTVTAAILIIGVTVAFFGLAATTTQILLVPRTPPVRPPAVPAPALATVPGADGAASPQAGGAASARAPEPAAKAAAAAAVPRGEPSAWMVVPVLAGALVLLVLGVHPPADLTGLLARAVRELSGVR
jgi:hydrogenase-4 component F